jgi:hypothetical protein
VVDAARAAAESAGARVADGDGLSTEADVLFVAGKAGVVDHDAVPQIRAGVVVPLTAVPITARAHAELTRAGIVHVPDFLSTAAALLKGHGDVADPVAAVAEKVSSLAPKGTGMWMAAVEEAEAFLRTWRDSLPFGRPLA